MYNFQKQIVQKIFGHGAIAPEHPCKIAQQGSAVPRVQFCKRSLVSLMNLLHQLLV